MTTQDYALRALTTQTPAVDRRSGQRSSLAVKLNDDQKILLSVKEAFGWRVRYVREPTFGEPEVIITDATDSALWILGTDGSLTETFNIRSVDLV